MNKLTGLLVFCALALAVACTNDSDKQSAADIQLRAESNCEAAPYATCDQLLATYVLSYIVIPNKPQSLNSDIEERLKKVEEIYKPTGMDEAAFNESKRVLSDMQLFAHGDENEKSQVMTSLHKQRSLHVHINHMITLKRYVEFMRSLKIHADQGKVRLSETGPKWFDWLSDSNYVKDQAKFIAFAKKKANCGSDAPGQVAISYGDQVNILKMTDRQKKRICNDKSFALTDEELIKLNYVL